jgi:hypothetical protein
MDCLVRVNTFKEFDRAFVFSKELSGELERIKIVLNGEEYPLKKLVDKKALQVSWLGDDLHLAIPDPSKILEITEAQENVLALKVESRNESTHQGAQLHVADGRDRLQCPLIVANASHQWGLPISETSVLVEVFRQWVPRGLQLVPDRSYRQDMELAVSSLIENYHN